MRRGDCGGNGDRGDRSVCVVCSPGLNISDRKSVKGKGKVWPRYGQARLIGAIFRANG